jgi:uncharacterized membrane protein YfcA
MNLDQLFLTVMTAIGVVLGVILAIYPEARALYIFVPVAMAAIELVCLIRPDRIAASRLSAQMRLLGFVLAILLMVLIPLFAGQAAGDV